MTNWERATAELNKPLNRDYVAKRSQSGMELSYIESWHAINEANRIFGYENWSCDTIHLEQVQQYEFNGKNKVCFLAKVRIDLKGGGSRVGTGYGSGISKDIGDAIESASKEAESDALKRALRTYGNQFGLALYDKSQANVKDPSPSPFPNSSQRNKFTRSLIGEFENALTEASLTALKESNRDMLAKMVKSDDELDEMAIAEIGKSFEKAMERLKSEPIDSRDMHLDEPHE